MATILLRFVTLIPLFSAHVATTSSRPAPQTPGFAMRLYTEDLRIEADQNPHVVVEISNSSGGELRVHRRISLHEGEWRPAAPTTSSPDEPEHTREARLVAVVQSGGRIDPFSFPSTTEEQPLTIPSGQSKLLKVTLPGSPFPEGNMNLRIDLVVNGQAVAMTRTVRLEVDNDDKKAK